MATLIVLIKETDLTDESLLKSVLIGALAGGISTYYEVGITHYGSVGTDVMFSEFSMNYYGANYIHLIGRSSGGKISSGTIMIDQAGSLTEKNLQTINTIGVYGSSSSLIGAGSYIEIWG